MPSSLVWVVRPTINLGNGGGHDWTGAFTQLDLGALGAQTRYTAVVPRSLRVVFDGTVTGLARMVFGVWVQTVEMAAPTTHAAVVAAVRARAAGTYRNESGTGTLVVPVLPAQCRVYLCCTFSVLSSTVADDATLVEARVSVGYHCTGEVSA
jgi:hypothetical protein